MKSSRSTPRSPRCSTRSTRRSPASRSTRGSRRSPSWRCSCMADPPQTGRPAFADALDPAAFCIGFRHWDVLRPPRRPRTRFRAPGVGAGVGQWNRRDRGCVGRRGRARRGPWREQQCVVELGGRLRRRVDELDPLLGPVYAASRSRLVGGRSHVWHARRHPGRAALQPGSPAVVAGRGVGPRLPGGQRLVGREHPPVRLLAVVRRRPGTRVQRPQDRSNPRSCSLTDAHRPGSTPSPKRCSTSSARRTASVQRSNVVGRRPPKTPAYAHVRPSVPFAANLS